MRKLSLFMAIAAALSSCTEKIDGGEQDVLMGVVASAQDFSNDTMTKTTISQEGSSAPSFAWKEGDVIGVVPMDNETVQSNYKIKQIGANPRQASFDGGVWALKEGKEYAAYYPFKKEAVVSGESITFSFEGQRQSENNSLAHIGDYDYMYANSISPSDGNVNFEFSHLVSLARFQLSLPSGTYESVKFEADDKWFASTATLYLEDGTLVSGGDAFSATLELDDIVLSTSSVLTVWMSSLPTAALNGKELRVIVTSKDGQYKGTISGIDTFEAGKAYSYSASLSSGQEHEYVDLGLSVKWATCNIGATKPEEDGYYIIWGNVEPSEYWSGKSRYYISETINDGGFTYEKKGYTKYVRKEDAESAGYDGFYDDKVTLEPEDDAAHIQWGGKWRTPTAEEVNQLLNRKNCTWEDVRLNGVYGAKITSKVPGYEGKWIFLPTGTQQSYWTSSLCMGSIYAYYLFVRPSDSYIHCSSGYRTYTNIRVRPVCD